jgi:hypothetical protein
MGDSTTTGTSNGITISLTRATRMKTTIELPDELVKQARRIARQEGVTLRALAEEGLQRGLEPRRPTVRRQLDFPSYGGSGLTDELRRAPWSRIRDEIYREHGVRVLWSADRDFSRFPESTVLSPLPRG